ncbi:hypothetical protein BD626DRAFT_518653 [Schizophyllum amplum]|uniref:Uncharacterized protein n=1 Tax=Schizophyllum amplum TaxID=97359 RepID=A0A550BVV5_9AGAR|nr:hypothetical protein BD626DRAFT_518653 [Auriculariopsis ampla]
MSAQRPRRTSSSPTSSSKPRWLGLLWQRRARATTAPAACVQHGSAWGTASYSTFVGSRGLSSQLAISTRTGCASGATASRYVGLLVTDAPDGDNVNVASGPHRIPILTTFAGVLVNVHRPQATHNTTTNLPSPSLRPSFASEYTYRHTETRAFVSSTRVMDASVHALGSHGRARRPWGLRQAYPR